MGGRASTGGIRSGATRRIVLRATDLDATGAVLDAGHGLAHRVRALAVVVAVADPGAVAEVTRAGAGRRVEVAVEIERLVGARLPAARGVVAADAAALGEARTVVDAATVAGRL